MSPNVYWAVCAFSVAGILLGIAMMSRVRTAWAGNFIGAVCTAAAVVVTISVNNLWADRLLGPCIMIGLAAGSLLAHHVQMISMPQVVAFLNALGGLASALVVLASPDGVPYVGPLALAVGMATFTGSMAAAGKLTRLVPQRPIVLPGHTVWTALSLAVSLVCVALSEFIPPYFLLVSASAFGILLSVRVGGADMPITISLLNSLSGVAGGIAGITVGDLVLTAVGGIVGASGLLLTQVMCKAMNRSLSAILLGGAVAVSAPPPPTSEEPTAAVSASPPEEAPSPGDLLSAARDVIIVPGYGMALAQAQEDVKALSDALEARGAQVRFAIHPVAGRMPGHMNVLLCEADIPYEKLNEMDSINEDFAACDLAVVVGANDVVNPAANTAEGTPIYGMPVLRVNEAPRVIICNLDTGNGYAGVPNPLYRDPRVTLLLGDAKETLREAVRALQAAG